MHVGVFLVQNASLIHQVYRGECLATTLALSQSMRWDKAKVVAREAQRQTRWIKEAVWIRKTRLA